MTSIIMKNSDSRTYGYNFRVIRTEVEHRSVAVYCLRQITRVWVRCGIVCILFRKSNQRKPCVFAAQLELVEQVLFFGFSIFGLYIYPT